MPAPAVDAATKEAVKAHAMQHGIRPAARDFNLPESTVKSWSTREKWLLPCVQVAPTPVTLRPKHASIASKPSQAALTARQRMDARTHKYGRQYAHDSLRHAARVARRDPETALADAPNVKAVVQIAQAANVAGFERQDGQARSAFSLTLNCLDPSVVIETPRVTDIETQ